MAPKRHYFKQVRFQQLQGFCETARWRSFAAAAARLALSPPALWHQIRALEREVGTRLVQRKGRGVELTEDGRLMFELAEPLVSGFASIQTVFAERKEAIHRRLCVASTSPLPLFSHELQSVIRRFCERYPQVHLTLVDRASPGVLQMVERGEADLGLTGILQDEADYARLEYEPLYAEPFQLICPADHVLARGRACRLERLARYPFVLMSPGTLTRHRVERIFREHGLWERLNVAVETTNFALVLDYVALGLGISVIAGNPKKGALHSWLTSKAVQFGRMTVGNTDGREVRGLHVQLASKWFGEETIALVWKKGAYQQEYVRAFRELVCQELAEKKNH